MRTLKSNITYLMIAKMKKTSLLEQEKMVQFPQLNFYTSEDGSIYFDATYYLEAKALCETYSVEKFRSEFAAWIIPAQKVYGINPDDMFILDTQTGHALIDESLALLFIAYTDELYRVVLLERMSEMEIAGVTVSDTQLTYMLRTRYTKEGVMKIMMDYGEE